MKDSLLDDPDFYRPEGMPEQPATEAGPEPMAQIIVPQPKPESCFPTLGESTLTPACFREALEDLENEEVREFIAENIVSAEVLFETRPPPRDPVIEGIFDAGSLVAIIAPSKCRKSFFALQMAACLASGLDFIGLEIPQRRKVLLVQFEVQPDDIHRRLKMLEIGIGGKPNVQNRLHIFNARGHDFNLSNFEKVIRELKPGVLILDPFYAMQEGGENAAEDMKPIFREFLRITKEHRCCVVYVHHDAKGNASSRNTRDRGSGSGVIGRAYDAAFLLAEHEEENHFVVETLLRSYPMRKPFSCHWSQGAFIPSNRPAIPKKPASPNTNPTTVQPDADFFPQIVEVLEATPGLNSTSLDTRLREASGVTRDKAAQVRIAAIGKGIICKDYVVPKGYLHTLPVSKRKSEG